jgi:hypothetical protein
MEEHELANLGHEVVRIAELAESVPPDSGANDLVVMKGDSVIAERSRVGLADIMQEGSESQSEAR